jgi:nitrate reductase molybdenum cofactor assembly chaperone
MLQGFGTKRVLALLADILDYPTSRAASDTQECRVLVSAISPEAAALLQEFQTLAEESSVSRLEELYTGVFDLDPVCHPYVGYHLFGESYKRSAFMVELKKEYRRYGFDVDGAELPDRLSVLLRFLAICDDEELRREMVGEGILPALDRMIDGKGKESVEQQFEEKLGSAITQLEGEGTEEEVLQGGFVLEMTEAAHSDNGQRPDRSGNLYRSVLQALRLFLQSSEFTRVEKQGAGIARVGGSRNA